VHLAYCADEIDLYDVTLSASLERASANAMKDLALAYKLTNPDLEFKFKSATSQEALAQITAGALDTGTVMQGWSPSIAATAPNMYMFPLFLTGFVPAYRLDALGKGAQAIVFTREALVGMFTGSITKWNHLMLTSANPLVAMPDQNITMVFDISGGARNWVIKNALYQFDAAAMNASSMKISNAVDYPFDKYAAYSTVESGSNALVSQISAIDGSFTLSYLSTATELEVSIGRMRNKAGSVVACTSDSLTLASLEATKQPATRTTAHVFTDAASDLAWPISYFVYVVIDVERSMSSCRARRYLTEFLSWTYTDSIAQAVAENRVFYPVPSLILQLSGVIDILHSKVTCRGSVAYPSRVTEVRDISVSPSFQFMTKLMSSIYQDDNIKFVANGIDENLSIKQMVNSEIDLAFITQENADKAHWNALKSSGDFLFLPLYAQGVTFMFNPQLSSTVSVPAGTKLVLDDSLMALLAIGCTNNWNDTRLAALNPWLSALTNNRSYPMNKVVGCGRGAVLAPMTQQMSAFIYTQKAAGQLSADANACEPHPSLTPAFKTCTPLPEHQLTFAATEMLVPSLALGIRGGFGFGYDNADANTLFPVYTRTVNGQQYYATSDETGIRNCASDTFDPVGITFDFSKSKHTECWPVVQQLVAVVRNRYYSSATNTSSCIRGVDVLKFLKFLITTESSHLITNSINVAQLFEVPGVREYYISALNQVVCDDETLLITLPTIWKLSEGLFAVSIAAAIVGFVVTNALAIYVIVQRRHPIVRSASPIFLLASLCGVQILFGAVIALVSNVSSMSCSALSWMVNLGIAVTFVPLFARQWRIYKIFSKRKLSVIKISNRKLMLFVVVCWLVELAFMAAWQGAGQLEPTLTVVWEGTPSRETHYTQCSPEGSIGHAFFGIAAAEKGCLLLFGALMAFSTRRVQSKFNESQSISLALYNIIFSIGIITPIIIVIGATGDVLIALLMFMIIWIAFFTACILVIPKALHIQAQGEDAADNQSVIGSSGNSSSGFSFLSLDMLSTLPMVGAYLSALRHHVEAVEQKHASLKRGSGIAQDKSEPQKRIDITDSTIITKNSTSAVDHRITTQRHMSQTASYPATGTGNLFRRTPSIS
jgi:ABC-type phosphate transport system substrate-binding protein